MKKLLALFAVMALALTLTACGGEAKLPADGEITMENMDDFMGRDNAQYIDLRNLEDRLKDGYVSGFSVVPYFNYLNNEEIITGKADTTTVVDEARVKQLFDMEAEAIFLMCASGGRAGWVKAALEGLGYTNVYNVGGFKDYSGENKVSGDGSYNLDVPVYGDYTPGVYHGESNGYLVVVVINENGGIQNVTFDAISCTEIKVDGASQDPKEYSSCTTKQTLGFDYNMKLYGTDVDHEWFEQADFMAAAIVGAQGWDTAWTVTNDGHHDRFDADVADAVANVTIGVEGFKAAFEDALGLGE